MYRFALYLLLSLGLWANTIHLAHAQDVPSPTQANPGPTQAGQSGKKTQATKPKPAPLKKGGKIKTNVKSAAKTPPDSSLRPPTLSNRADSTLPNPNDLSKKIDTARNRIGNDIIPQPDTQKIATRAELDSARATPPSGVTPKDTTRKESYWGRPQRAALYSAVLPGAGQIYNGHWYKVPVIYAGFGFLAYLIAFNNKYYQGFNKSVRIKNDAGAAVRLVSDTALSRLGDPYPELALTQVLRGRDFYRRNRDLSIIVTAFVYLLQVADAHVFAHLKDFNVGENLSLAPTAIPTGGPSAAGIALTWRPGQLKKVGR